MIDIVTVFHNEKNCLETAQLQAQLHEHEDPNRFTFTIVDNSINNRGFAKACNIGAAKGDAPVIGFLNPDSLVSGPFVDEVLAVLEDPTVVITGCNHGKPQREVRAWGLNNWICGCSMFVRRSFFEEVGGFDERYVWSFEDTDLCRTAESMGLRVRPIGLPLHHESPAENSEKDAQYKRFHFDVAHREYYKKWRSQ